MDCETCNDLLLDLHYDELDRARAEEVRAHLDVCEACRAASARLTRTRSLLAGLTLPDAPPHSAAVMAALASTAPLTAAVSGRVSAVIPIERAREAKASGWLQRVGELAMRRQVAMVAISLLMVGLGLRYLPFRSPTQSVTTETAQPEVIPATELAPPPPVSMVPAPASAPATTMRSRAQAARPSLTAAEGRAGYRPTNIDALRGASAGSGAEVVADGRTARLGNAAQHSVGHGATAAELGVAERPAPAAVTAPSYNGLPPAPADEERQLQQALPAAPAPLAATWSTAQASGDSAAARGDREAMIAGYQRALALEPPPAQRRAIALSLARALTDMGRVEDASRVRAQYLTPAADPSALAGQVSSVPRSQTAAGMAQPSTPRPASARPARRSINNVNTDFNQSAY